MNPLRVLAVTFDNTITPWELPKFRGAIAAKVGLQHEWFHNHNNETGGYHQRYPLIQYKIDTQGRTMHPMLLYLDTCIEEAQHFFTQPDWSVRLGQTSQDLRIANLHIDQVALRLSDEPLRYRIHKWRALNSDNFKQWQQLRSLSDKYAFLESLLASHILSFARGVNWTLEGRFDISITQLLKEEWISFKDIKMLAFTLEFEANITLPNYIGLGNGAGEGFGVVRRQRRG